MEAEEVERERNDSNDSDDSDETAWHWRMRRREASDDDLESDVSSGRRAGSRFEDEVESLGGAPSSTEDVVADVAECAEREGEAFVVPTCGSFYLHDDRFVTSYSQCWNVYGGRGLKGVKKESKWAHDKFQEMSMNDSKKQNFNVWRTGNGAHQVH